MGNRLQFFRSSTKLPTLTPPSPFLNSPIVSKSHCQSEKKNFMKLSLSTTSPPDFQSDALAQTSYLLSFMKSFFPPSFVQKYRFNFSFMSNNNPILVIFSSNWTETEVGIQQPSREPLLWFQASISTYWWFTLVGRRAKHLFSLFYHCWMKQCEKGQGSPTLCIYCTVDTDFLLRPSIPHRVSLDEHRSDQL